MAIRAFFITFGQPLWVEVVANLAHQQIVDPLYWTAHASVEGTIRQRFPTIIFHERFDAARGIIPPECTHLKQEPLDHDFLAELAVHESIALKMMERMDMADSFSYQERVDLYHRHLRYWLAVLRHYQPQIVLFYSSPHFIYDYILYALCQTLGVLTRIFIRASLPDWSFSVEHLETGSSTLAETYGKLLQTPPKHIDLSPETETYLQRLVGPYEHAQPAFMKDQLRREEGLKLSVIGRRLFEPSGFSQYVNEMRRSIGSATKAVLTRKAAHTVVKEKGKPVEETPTLLSYVRLKLDAHLKQKRLKAHYERLARAVDLNKPYVFCALHMQPERTTSPDGGIFVHQYLVIDLLAKSLPVGWYLYVKEHNSQLLPNIHFDSSCAQLRSARFYDDIAALPNVEFVSLSRSSFELIDQARAVATVTGTVGWEAVARGKPVLAFGYPWYLGCEGVFHTPTRESLREALSKIASGYTIDREKVRLFAHVIEQIGFKHIYTRTQDTTVTYDELVAEYTRALQHVLAERFYEPIPSYKR